MKRLALIFVICLTILAPAAAEKREILVAAAASLTDVLSSLGPEVEKSVGAKVTFNFAASGTLRRQIEEGAPIDVFFSAASEDMDRLEKAGHIEPGTRKDLLTNSIVLVGGDGQEKPKDVSELAVLLKAADLLAIGNPDSVPAGRYAVQVLKSLALYPFVERKLVLGGNVRQVLQFVESGSAPLGIVFATDAGSVASGSPVRRLYDFPASALATPILYPIAVVSSSKNKADGKRFIAFLLEKSSLDTFERYGFGLK